MLIPLYIALVLVIGLAISHFWVLKQWKRSGQREERARSDREEVVAFLNHFATSIVNSTNPHRWMKLVAGYVASTIGASSLCIYALEKGELLKVAATGTPLEPPPIPQSNSLANRLLSELQQDQLDLLSSRIGEVLSSSSSLHESFPSAQRPGIESIMVVPINSGDNNVGVICAVNKRLPGLRYNQDDLFLLQSLSNQVAFGTYFIGVFEELTVRERIRQELVLAREIQTSLLPPRPPAGRRLKVDAVNIPAREVSGDFYDFIALDEDTMMVVIADASGKGVPACMLMAMCRSFLRTNVQHYRNDLEGLLKHLNQNLYDDTDELQFVTMACCLVDKRDNTIEYARAGHTELLIRHASDEIHIIQPQGPALGLLPGDMNPQFDTFAFSWLPGSSLLLFTDGITEALNQDEEEFGLDRLIESWKTQPADPAEATKGLLQSLHEFTGSNLQNDDLTMVMLTRASETDPVA